MCYTGKKTTAVYQWEERAAQGLAGCLSPGVAHCTSQGLEVHFPPLVFSAEKLMKSQQTDLSSNIINSAIKVYH